MNRSTMLIASSVALAPAMAFARQPRAPAPLMQRQAQPRLLSLALQDRAEIMRELQPRAGERQTPQMMSNVANMLYDTALSVIRKLGG